MVNMPRGTLTAEKKISMEIPIITSGRTIGKKLIVWMYPRPRNRYQLTPIEARVPSTVATKAEAKAIIKLFPKESHSFVEFIKSLEYHCREKPVHTIPLALLNE